MLSIFSVIISHKTEEDDLGAFWKHEAIGIESPESHEKENDYIRSNEESSIAKLTWKHDND